MSRDIRSFFQPMQKGTGKPLAPNVPVSNTASSTSRKKPKIVMEDDPPSKKTKATKPKRRYVISSSDEECDNDAKHSNARETDTKKRKVEEPKKTETLKKISNSDIENLLGSKPVQVKKKEDKSESRHRNDEKTPEKVNNNNNEVKSFKKPTSSEKDRGEKKSYLKEIERSSEKKRESKRLRSITPKKNEVKEEPNKKSRDKSKEKNERKENNTPKKSYLKREAHDTKSTEKLKQSAKKKKSNVDVQSVENLDQSIDDAAAMDADRYEKKRYSAMLYQQFKNRAGPANPGSKEIPKGKPDCLKGLTFLLTGVLESMERDDAAKLIETHGGRIVGGVSKKVNYVVTGADAGPAKLEKAQSINIPIISEDDLLNLIRKKSNLPIVKQEPVDDYEDFEKPVKVQKVQSPVKSKSGKITPVKVKAESSTENFNKLPERNVDRSMGIKPIDGNAMCWTEKYKPKSTKDIIGQFGPSSNCAKLLNWLSKWYINRKNPNLKKPSPWAKNDDGSYYKAVLLSGPPGVGKTTTATLVSQELGFDLVEFNASDTRSKKTLQQQVVEILQSTSLFHYCHGESKKVTKKHVLIMDEVDGMAGNEDRGGVQELITLIKNSSIPIICMCNDRQHPKIRSLSNYCFDLRFNKPSSQQIAGAMRRVLHEEKIEMPIDKINEVIQATNNDVRQTLNFLSLMSKDESKAMELKGKTATKDLKLGPWEVIRKVFSAEEHKNMTIHDKSDLFFYDYSIAPLFVQQNYLVVQPSGQSSKNLWKVAKTADSLSLGDMVDSRIRSNNAWSLLPVQAMFSSVLPGEYMSGKIAGQINFPSWLGKYSSQRKRSRLAQEINDHTRVKISGSRISVRLDYAPYILLRIVKPLVDTGLDGVNEAISVLREYRLLREDIESLIELTSWKGKKNLWESVDSKVKAALTRQYNKELAPAAVKTTKSKKKSTDSEEYDEEGNLIDDGGDDEDEEDDNINNDNLIKVKTKPAAKLKKENVKKPSTSKASGSRTKKK